MKKLLLFFLFFSQLGFCQSIGSIPSEAVSPKPEILVFVSFSMPEQSLKLWSEQAAKVGAKLLLRGFFEDSLQKTTSKAFELFGEKGGTELLIDPESFQQFGIQAVPALVLTEKKECLSEPCSPPKFDLIYGDIGLEEALQLIASKGTHQNKAWAEVLLRHYRGMDE